LLITIYQTKSKSLAEIIYETQAAEFNPESNDVKKGALANNTY